jgi:hypothetical protein
LWFINFINMLTIARACRQSTAVASWLLHSNSGDPSRVVQRQVPGVLPTPLNPNACQILQQLNSLLLGCALYRVPFAIGVFSPSGYIDTLYLDEDLRISKGEQSASVIKHMLFSTVCREVRLGIACIKGAADCRSVPCVLNDLLTELFSCLLRM